MAQESRDRVVERCLSMLGEGPSVPDGADLYTRLELACMSASRQLTMSQLSDSTRSYRNMSLSAVREGATSSLAESLRNSRSGLRESIASSEASRLLETAVELERKDRSKRSLWWYCGDIVGPAFVFLLVVLFFALAMSLTTRDQYA